MILFYKFLKLSGFDSIKQIAAILLFLFLAANSTSAQEVLKINSIEQANEEIEDYIYVYVDTTNALDINQILVKKGQNFFAPVLQFKKKISTDNTYWLYFSIKNTLGYNSSLGLLIPKQNHLVDIFILADSTSYTLSAGFFRESKENDEIIPYKGIVQIKNDQRVSFYIKIKNINDELPNFSIKLVDLRMAIKQNNRITIFDGFVQGIMWLMIFYGMFLFFQNKDKLYLYYSIYIFFIAIWFFCCMGFGYRIIPSFPKKIFPYLDIPLVIGYVFYLKFLISFINTSQVLPKWDKVLRFFQIVLLIEAVRIPVFIALTNLVMVNYLIENVVSISILLLFIAFIIRLLLLKTKLTNIVALGSSFLILGNLISSILFVMFLDDSVYILLQIGVISELLVFTYGISFRYALNEAEKQKFQSQLIDQLSENAELHQKVNRELADKVKERTIELEQQRDIVISQKDHIERINTEITDSIRYAKYIQSSILPKPDLLDSYLGEHFVLFKPKDIVSGDFYWTSRIENKTIIAAADCTGHGVPGAFMSMLGTALLNEIINKEYITHPGVILRRLRKEVINSLQQKGERGEQKDGMDIALCSLDLENMKLQFAGANNPIYIIRKSNQKKAGVLRCELPGDNCLYEIKGDMMPIGIFDRMENFTLHEIDIYRGDSIYMFTDGFPDQFGGPLKKKYGYRQFREQLLRNSPATMADQKKMLENSLTEWTGDGNQIDDILVIGFRVSQLIQ